VIGQVLQELFDSGKLKREDIFVTKNVGFFGRVNCTFMLIFRLTVVLVLQL
jgi:hypothetical protein